MQVCRPATERRIAEILKTVSFMSDPPPVSILAAANRASIVLICGTNEQYAMPLAVTLSSLLINLRSRVSVRIFVLNTTLSGEAKRRLKRATAQKRHDIDLVFTSVNPDLLSSYSPIKHLTVDTMLRLLAPDLMPSDIEKALYLDSDLCVLKDITPLWGIDETHFPVCASIDPSVRVISNEWGLSNYKELGIPGNSPYFNAGVLLMNLRMWRQEQIGRTCLEYLKNHRSHFLDQDAVNAILAGRIGLLPMTWNANVNELWHYSRWPEDDLKRAIAPELRNLKRSPAICHYAGAIKPWMPGLRTRFQVRWIYYLWRSRWFNLWEATLWTVKWSTMHVGIMFKRKVIVKVFGIRQTK